MAAGPVSHQKKSSALISPVVAAAGSISTFKCTHVAGRHGQRLLVLFSKVQNAATSALSTRQWHEWLCRAGQMQAAGSALCGLPDKFQIQVTRGRGGLRAQAHPQAQVEKVKAVTRTDSLQLIKCLLKVVIRSQDFCSAESASAAGLCQAHAIPAPAVIRSKPRTIPGSAQAT